MAKVQAKINTAEGQSRTVEVEYAPFDANDLAALVSEFGEEQVFNSAKRGFVVALQSFIRGHEDKSDEDIQAAVNDWKPGSRKPGKSPQERIQDLMSKLSPEAKDAVLREYGIKPKKAAA